MDSDTTRSVIGPDLQVTGELTSKGTMWIHGQVDGTAVAKTVVIEKGGHVKGTISADTVVIAGKVEGEVSAQSVEIKEGAHVEADIQHEQISVASGAALLGQVRRRTSAAVKASSDTGPRPVESIHS
jgi:cytoskeletal protein CcmA (bactofilin family)